MPDLVETPRRPQGTGGVNNGQEGETNPSGEAGPSGVQDPQSPVVVIPRKKKKKTRSPRVKSAVTVSKPSYNEISAQLKESQRGMMSLIEGLNPVLRRIKKEDVSSTRDMFTFLKEARALNISFSGSGNVRDFVKSVERLLELVPLSDLDTVKALRSLLVDSARTWFEARSDNLGDWFDVKQQLLQSYLPVNHDAKLRQVVSNRKQTENERVGHYISEIRQLNSELRRPLDESELLESLMVNLRNEYLMHIHFTKFRDTEELEKACVLIEKVHDLQKFNNGDKKAIVDDLAICSMKADVPQVCFKCQKVGHFVRECPLNASGSGSGIAKLSESNDNTLAKNVKDLTELVQALRMEVAELKNSKN